GFLGAHSDEIYHLPDDDLYLVGTSEVALAGYHQGEILDLSEGPKRYCGWSSCFRREAGSHGKDTRGIIRVHQFGKVEMFSWCTPEEAPAEHQRLLGFEKEMLQAMGLPFRVIDIAGGDLGSSAARKYDCEAWVPTRAPTASSRRPPTARPSRPAVWGCATATPTASPRPPPRSTARWPPPAGWWRSSRTTSRPTAPWWCPRRCGRSWARTCSNRRAERCPDSGPEQHHDAARAGARAAFRVEHLDLHHGGRPPGVLDLRPDRGRGAVRAESADVADGQVEGVEAHALLDDRRG